MEESSRSTAPSLKRRRGSGDRLTKQHTYLSNLDTTYGHSKNKLHRSNDWEILHGHGDSHRLYPEDANGVNQPNMPNVGFDTDEIIAHNVAPLRDTPCDTVHPETSSLCVVNDSFSGEEPSLVPMSSAQPPASRHSSALPRTSSRNYGPFLGRFATSEEAKAYRRNRMRFDRVPCRDPSSDPTIAETEINRDFHVERIYNAMICGDFARDNAKSTALKRWVYEAHYQSDLVEAYAHKVFDCLLEQVKKGFRGWHQNDYVNDERKGDDDDRDTDCAGRLDNIITALQQEKSICENVMSSAWQIRMFVNAPKAYAKRKDQNRVGNSKRPHAKISEGTECEARPAKRPRTTSAVRSKQGKGGSMISEPRLLRHPDPHTQHHRDYEPVSKESSETNTGPRVSCTYPSPRSHGDFSGLQANATLHSTPRPQPVLHTPRQNSLQHIMPTSTVHQQPFSPLPSPQNNLQTWTRSDSIASVMNAANFEDWQDVPHPDLFTGASEPRGTMDKAVAGEGQQDTAPFSPCDTSDYAGILTGDAERGVYLSGVELMPPLLTEEDRLLDEFLQRYW